jgi:anti-sigma regulatory factor (Ser/Thr protein kinase)
VEVGTDARGTVSASTTAWAEASLDALTALPGVRRAGIAVSEGGGRRHDFTSAEPPGAGPAAWCRIDAYDDVPLNTAIRSGRAVTGTLVELQKSHPAFVERQAGTGTTALAAVPLVAADRVIGGFVLFYREAPDFDSRGVADLVELGARLGEALHRIRTAHLGEVTDWVREPAPGAPVMRLTIGTEPAAVRSARQELRAALAGWGIDEDTAYTAAVCMSELVTNAVVHAASGCRVQVINDAGTVTVEVRDPGRGADLTPADVNDPLRVDGRGLQLVDGLASRWGSSRDSRGFSAWFVLDG